VVSSTALLISIPDFQVYGCTGETFTYSAVWVDSSVENILPSFITLTAKTFNVYTIDSNDVGSYSIKVTGTM
jgi:hypothetical protein